MYLKPFGTRWTSQYQLSMVTQHGHCYRHYTPSIFKFPITGHTLISDSRDFTSTMSPVIRWHHNWSLSQILCLFHITDTVITTSMAIASAITHSIPNYLLSNITPCRISLTGNQSAHWYTIVAIDLTWLQQWVRVFWQHTLSLSMVDLTPGWLDIYS